eukprot:CAMPEP_0202102986 /NCGR_PEP_ID=MMETSP0965-20130614/4622_1 /ASSEMBLY_ACC=CAM_ASM_000507 /TAXON_ID=4773 /ORGANISM="Schizochytrium aggregatum, Strain ATCC28209" /LENGTH=143 /DNA_ID=CAMNT_0048671769 /DNA_START=537 /DNA_END=965 /DNA_ORIENTATION=-
MESSGGSLGRPLAVARDDPKVVAGLVPAVAQAHGDHERVVEVARVLVCLEMKGVSLEQAGREELDLVLGQVHTKAVARAGLKDRHFEHGLQVGRASRIRNVHPPLWTERLWLLEAVRVAAMTYGKKASLTPAGIVVPSGNVTS